MMDQLGQSIGGNLVEKADLDLGKIRQTRQINNWTPTGPNYFNYISYYKVYYNC